MPVILILDFKMNSCIGREIKIIDLRFKLRHEAAQEMREGPSEPACRSQASNHLKLLWSKARVVSVKEKSRLRLWQVRIRETSEAEPLMRCRKQEDGVKTGGLSDFQDESRGSLLTAWAGRPA